VLDLDVWGRFGEILRVRVGLEVSGEVDGAIGFDAGVCVDGWQVVDKGLAEVCDYRGHDRGDKRAQL